MIHNKWEPNWSAFVNWMGMFYEAGEYGVIYTDKRTPYQLIKVVNTDITDGDSNYDQAEFFEDNWKRNIEGLVKVYSYTSCEAKSGIMNPLVGNVVRATSEDAQEILRVLDMDVGDNLAMWVMEKANYVGLTHPNLTREEMIERVAQAAFNIGTRTGYGIGDLKERNYGFREDGSALIFDFNLMGDENATLDTYRAKVKSFANTKV
jgi:hypothetical protein